MDSLLETRLRIGFALVKFFAWVRGGALTYTEWKEAADVADDIAWQETRRAGR